MVKNFLAFLGFMFLTLFIVTVALGVGVFYDWAGLITLPAGARYALKDIAAELAPRPSGTPQITLSAPEITNLVNPIFAATSLPAPTDTPEPLPTPVPTSTPTPIPPLDPQVYQDLTLSRLKDFAGALQRWMTANSDLGQNSSLASDPTWKKQAQANLEDIQTTAQALADVGPAPDEYRQIDGWFNRVLVEANGLSESYTQALQTGDPGYYAAASHNFDQIKNDLSQAVTAMQAAGWNLK